ncbi:MAG TPA: cobalt transporter CbiM, partial [Dehalococcoidia bacterium]|nr:cobalt transporter CbiM [Dehalococcoidia bacterium]
MHIPDGYLSPATCAVLYGAALPFWAVAARKVGKLMKARMVPLIALFSAFAFALQMFNVPLPGGTTGHAVGGTLLALVLGPWGAVVGLSVVFLLQALFFGDGGITAYGANAFNMAIVLPLAGYALYRFLITLLPGKQVMAAAIASYIAMMLAALLTALELGLQPRLFHAADGTPLYAPYDLKIALPAVMVPHLLVAGPIEAVVTGLVLAFLLRTRMPLGVMPQPRPLPLRWLWVGLGLVALLTPIGMMASGTAWGEWGGDDLKEMLGFVPQGLARLENMWQAPFSGYSLPGIGPVAGYIASAI